MREQGARWVGAALSGVLLVAMAAGCGGSGAEAATLSDGIEELSSVGGPDGRDPSEVKVVGCDDEAEMAAGYAFYEDEGLDPRNVDAFNADIAKVEEWYLPRWRTLGWEPDEDMVGSATKEVAGTQLRASIDVGKGTGYAILVAEDGGGLCG